MASSLKGTAINLRLIKPGERTADLLLEGRVGPIAQKLVREMPYTMESLVRVLLTALMFIGAWRAWKKRDVFLILLFLLIVQFALLTSPWSETRFRIALEPYMLLFAFSVLMGQWHKIMLR